MTPQEIEVLAIKAYPIYRNSLNEDVDKHKRAVWIEGATAIVDMFNNVSRFECINHLKSSNFQAGRALVFNKDVDNAHEISYSFQDDNKTLKIFVK